MNFFEHQANARRQTGRLLVYFTLAVVLTIAAVNTGLFVLGSLINASHGHWYWHDWSAQAVVAVLLVVLGGSLLEFLRLRGGGKAIAELMGGRRIDFATTDAKERQFINVVAEMAIASGVPAPVLYVMEREYGINAFVAGLNMDETVMVVTAGALDAFDRDELQAVVGHEFSHILNGDMRLNVRLMALLAGILAIGQIGGFMMRVGADFGSSGSSSSRRDRGFSPHLIALGFMLWAIGALGLFFGRLIKAAISRQREFLADASSVQFTRNPDGLASALLKIRNGSQQSWLGNVRAESMSHMCFGETLRFSDFFATHPPLEERIAVLGKHYLVRDRARQRVQRRQTETAAQVALAQELPLAEKPRDLPPIPFIDNPAMPSAPQMLALAAPAAALVARAGTVRPEELESARELHRRLPVGIQQALQGSAGAQALLYALMARQSAAPEAVVQAFLQKQEPQLLAQVNILFRLLEGLDLCYALPLTELALPRLQLLDAATQRSFLGRLQAFAQLDRRLSTFEFALLMLLRKQLHIGPKPRAVKLAQCTPLVASMVATFLRTGGMEGEKLERTYLRLMRTVTMAPPALPGQEFTRLSQLAMGMQVLGGLSLVERRSLLELAATAVLADAEIRLEEYELLRVVAALLDCPMPKLAA
ncbi:MAG: M48 family metallopeptidase [Pedobacter sp.]|nr:M48 family metallopeptidase [Pedobacter sp.]